MNGTDWKNKEFTMKELCADMPEIVAYETLEHAKEGYQDIQRIFAQAYEKVCAPHSDISHEDLSFYLLALARTAPEIDEEVFDHKMNLVTQYRKVLKKNLSAFELGSGFCKTRKRKHKDCLRKQNAASRKV